MDAARTRDPWATPGIVARLTMHWRDGRSDAEAAERLSVEFARTISPDAVRSKRRHLGLERSLSSDPQLGAAGITLAGGYVYRGGTIARAESRP